MSFRNTLLKADNMDAINSLNFESTDIAFLISLIDDEAKERKFNNLINGYRSNMEALDQLKEFESNFLAIEEEYASINKDVNMESIDSIVALSNIQERLVSLTYNFRSIDPDTFFTTNSEDLVVNIEGLMTELSNSIEQAFSNIFTDVSRFIKSIRNLFASLIGNRRRKLSALKAQLISSSNPKVSDYVNNEFVSDYFGPLKLSNFDVAGTLEQIDDLQLFVQGLIGGRYPDDTGSIGVKIDKNHPDIQDRAKDIMGYTTYRNYSGMRLDDVKCLGYRYSNNTIKAYLSFIFKVPKESITKFPFSLRDFKNVNYGSIKIMDGRDVFVRVNETVAVNFRYEHKQIKFDKNVAVRAIDNELLRINKISGIILKSNIQDIIKALQSIALGVMSAFDKAIPVGVAKEIDIGITALNPVISLLKLLFYGNKLTDWFRLTYFKSFSGLVEMSKMNYDMIVDYSNIIINSEDMR